MKLLLWVCGIAVFLVVVLLGVATLINTSSNPPITYQRFEEMLRQHDVDRIVTYKSGDLLMAEVFLKSGSIGKSEYHDAQHQGKNSFGSGSGENTPQYVFTAVTFDGLVKQINDSENEAHYTDADKSALSVSLEAGSEGLLSNWLVQCVIMLIMLAVPILCGYLGFGEGKKRTIGSVPGLLLGMFFGPIGLIIVYLSDKKPLQKNGGIRV